MEHKTCTQLFGCRLTRARGGVSKASTYAQVWDYLMSFSPRATISQYMGEVLLRQDIGLIIEISPAPTTRIVRWVTNIIECKVRPIGRILKTQGRTALTVGFVGENVAVHAVCAVYYRDAAVKDREGSIFIENEPMVLAVGFHEFSSGKT